MHKHCAILGLKHRGDGDANHSGLGFSLVYRNNTSRGLPYSDGRQSNATCQELNLIGMLRLSKYDDAVSVNTSAYGDSIRRALASVGVITQRAPCAARCSLLQ